MSTASATPPPQQQHQQQQVEEPSQRLRIIFVGTGVSTCIPVIGHLNKDCACKLALQDPKNKNNRNNVSIMVQEWGKLEPRPQPARDESAAEGEQQQQQQLSEQEARQRARFAPKDAEAKPQQKEEFGWRNNVLFDIGKSFRAAYWRVLAPMGIAHIDALLFTHEHADALLGLDDIRDVQNFTTVPPQWFWRIDELAQVYLSPFCLKTVQRVFSYIFKNSRIHKGFVSRAVPGYEEKETIKPAEDPDAVPHGGGVLHPIEPWKPIVIERRVAALDFLLMDEDHGVFEIAIPPAGIKGKWYGVPMEHGAKYISNGFIFGAHDGCRVAYLSDVSRITETTLRFLKNVGPIEVLVIDALLPFGDTVHFSHYGCDQAWALAKELDPKSAYGTGMWCAIEHEETNKHMAKLLEEHRAANPAARLSKFELAWDGLVLEL